MAASRILVLDGGTTGGWTPNAVEVLANRFPEYEVVTDPEPPADGGPVACVVATEVGEDLAAFLQSTEVPLVYVGGTGDAVPAGALAAGAVEWCDPSTADDPGSALAGAVAAVLPDDATTGAPTGEDPPRYSLERLPDPAYVTDAEGRIECVNPAFREQLDVEADGAVGGRLDEVVAAGGPVRASERDGDVVEVTVGDGDARRTFEVHERTAEGGTVGVLHEVTEREARRERLQTIEGRYRRMVEQDLFGIYIIQSGEIRFANRRAAELFGYTPAEMMDGMTAFDVVDERDHERLAENIRKREEGEVTDLRYELRGVRKDGSQFEFEVHSGLIEYDGDPALLGAIIDITERKRRRQRLRVLNRVLRHNLRNDLNVVIGRMQDAVDRLLDHGDERGAEVVTQGLKEAQDLLSTTEKLRKIQETLERDPGEDPGIDAVAAIEPIVEFAREKHPEATVRTDLPERAVVEADRSLEIVVENLVVNAIEHNDCDPTVEVSIAELDRERGDWYELRVADDGPGIPEQEQVVVDEGVEVTPLRHSSGLGLWTVAWIVQSFDGAVEVETDEEGSVVTVALQAAGSPGVGEHQ